MVCSRHVLSLQLHTSLESAIVTFFITVAIQLPIMLLVDFLTVLRLDLALFDRFTLHWLAKDNRWRIIAFMSIVLAGGALFSGPNLARVFEQQFT